MFPTLGAHQLKNGISTTYSGRYAILQCILHIVVDMLSRIDYIKMYQIIILIHFNIINT